MSKPADSSLDRIRRHLVGLKMPCALESLQDTVQRIERGELSTFEAIEALLGEELTTRQSRRIKMALQTARLSTIKDNDKDFVSPGDMLNELMNDNKAVIKRMRAAHEVADRHEDVATASILENFIDQAEKRNWFLFEASRSGSSGGH